MRIFSSYFFSVFLIYLMVGELWVAVTVLTKKRKNYKYYKNKMIEEIRILEHKKKIGLNPKINLKIDNKSNSKLENKLDFDNKIVPMNNDNQNPVIKKKKKYSIMRIRKNIEENKKERVRNSIFSSSPQKLMIKESNSLTNKEVLLKKLSKEEKIKLDNLLYTNYEHLLITYINKDITKSQTLIIEKYTEGLSLKYVLEKKEFSLIIFENLRYLLISIVISSLQMLNRI